MCRFRSALCLLALVCTAGLCEAQAQGSAQGASRGAARYSGLGRAATPAEVKAWDIDVRPDFKGLPPGAGSVAKGLEVWEAKCASCHGVFGESNEVFNPVAGGVSAADMQAGRASRLKDGSFSSRTTVMKLATVSTLWDYINRAMPWTQPKSLTVEEVYATTAYLLNLNGVLPDDFTLSNHNIAEVQRRMPNRDGMTTRHALWPGAGFAGHALPDTRNTLCMKDCGPAPQVASSIPDYARNQHGNLAEQNRMVGPQRGVDTTRPPAAMPATALSLPVAVAVAAPVVAAQTVAVPGNQAAQALARKHACVACHAMAGKLVGPSFADIAQKYRGQADYLAGKIKAGGSGVWGAIPMPAQSLGDADARAIAAWLAAGAGK